MNPNNLFICFSLFSLFLFFSPSSAHNKSHAGHNKHHEASSMQSSYKGCFSKVYAFGGSYTDTGNAQIMGTGQGQTSGTDIGNAQIIGAGQGQTSGSYADTGNTQITGAGQTSSAGKPINRSCDGRLVVDFLCDALSLPPLPPSKSTSSNFSNGANFATAGSTGLSSRSLWWKDASVNLQSQAEWYKKSLQEVEYKGGNSNTGKAELDDALFWIGATGVTDYARAGSSASPLHSLTEMSVLHNCELVQTLLESGAKYIVVQGLPPVGCLPLGLSSCSQLNRDKTGCNAILNSAVMIHNEILQRKLQNFQAQYPSSTILYADYWNAYLTILMNPTKYHFEEHFKACCGADDGELNFNPNSLCGSAGTSACNDPGNYISWDGIHLTEAMHKQIADLFLNQGFCRPSFDQLVKKKSGM